MKKILLLLGILTATVCALAQEAATRDILERLALASSSEQSAIVDELAALSDPYIKDFVEAWRVGEVYSYEVSEEETIVLRKISERFRRLSNDGVIEIANEDEDENLSKNRPSRRLRRALKTITDTIDLSSPDPKTRIEAALKLGLSQNADYLAALYKKLEIEENEKVRKKFEEAINLSLLANADGDEALKAAIVRLGELESLPARDGITSIQNRATESEDEELAEVCDAAIKKIDMAQATIERWGNLVRGLSTGSVLLIVAFGLA
ncbi:MAG: urea ABC transporter permease subunit UrtB, partial [Verrucomicrobiota bacterium]